MNVKIKKIQGARSSCTLSVWNQAIYILSKFSKLAGIEVMDGRLSLDEGEEIRCIQTETGALSSFKRKILF